MIKLSNKNQLERAIATAKILKPRITFSKDPAEFGTYTVEGRTGTNYVVKCWKEKNSPMVSCTCPAHVASTEPKMCYHIAAVVSVHIARARIRDLENQAAAAALIQSVNLVTSR